MSMADNRRNHPDFSEDEFAPNSRESADPLAELARLIGQNDPFADPGRQTARKPLDTVKADDRPAPEWLSRPVSAADEGEYDPAPAPRAESPTRYRDEYRAELAAYRPSSFAPAQAAADAHDPHEEPAHDEPAPHDAERYAEEGAGEDFAGQSFAARDDVHASAVHPDHEDRGDSRYRVALPAPEYDGDGYYAEDGHMPPHAEESHQPSRRRGGLLTVAAVIGLAVIGTAGA